jgi:hypothetical protein
MNHSRIAVYVVTALSVVFGVVYVADALVETDAERLEGLDARLAASHGEARVDELMHWAGDESIAIVADGQRDWIEGDDTALRTAIDAALPELASSELTVHEVELTGRRGYVHLQMRGEEGVSRATIALALQGEPEEGARFALVEVRRLHD